MCPSLSPILLCVHHYHQFYYVSIIITNFTMCPSLSPVFYVSVITNSAMFLSLSSISRLNRRSLIEEPRIRSWTNFSGVFDGHGNIRRGRPPNTSVSPSQYNCTKAPYSYFIYLPPTLRGHAVAQLVDALRNKPEGRGFDLRWCHWKFSLA